MPDHDYNEDYSDSLDRPSKTQQKAAMHALRDLGSELVELSPGQLKRMDLPEALYAAVRDAQKITAHGARRRQLQYIGKLMRRLDEVETAAICAVLGTLRTPRR